MQLLHQPWLGKGPAFLSSIHTGSRLFLLLELRPPPPPPPTWLNGVPGAANLECPCVPLPTPPRSQQLHLSAVKLAELHSDLKIQEKNELSWKKLKAEGLDEDGEKEAKLRRDLNGKQGGELQCSHVGRSWETGKDPSPLESQANLLWVPGSGLSSDIGVQNPRNQVACVIGLGPTESKRETFVFLSHKREARTRHPPPPRFS